MKILFALCACCLAIGAEAPNLEVRVEPGDGESRVIVTNRHSVAAVAYCLHIDERRMGSTSDGYILDDAVWGGANAVIAPGASTRGVAASDVSKNKVSAEVAVLYADGTTAGFPAGIERIMDGRRSALMDAARVRGTINASRTPEELRSTLEQFAKGRTPPRAGVTGAANASAAMESMRRYVASPLPRVVLGWMKETTDKTALVSRLDALTSEITKTTPGLMTGGN